MRHPHAHALKHVHSFTHTLTHTRTDLDKSELCRHLTAIGLLKQTPSADTSQELSTPNLSDYTNKYGDGHGHGDGDGHDDDENGDGKEDVWTLRFRAAAIELCKLSYKTDLGHVFLLLTGMIQECTSIFLLA